MVTKIDPISTPPTPVDPPSVFEERASQVWADLFKAVPQMNQQALDIDAIGKAADVAKCSAQADSDAALAYRNEAGAAKTAALGHAGSSAQSSADADAARGFAIAAAVDAESAADRAEVAAAAAESVVANAAQSVKDWVDQQIGFAIIYPNGGSAAAPANVAINSRYVLANPFPGYQVLCVAELKPAGFDWGEPGFVAGTSGDGFGTRASIYSDSIVVQTGSLGLYGYSKVDGNPWNISAGTPNTPTPCRVKVWKLKGAV